MSSLQLYISAKEDKDKIVVYECTGKYSGSNSGGWGKPNYELSMVTKAQFEVYPPQVTTPIIIQIFPEFPTDDKDIGYELPVSFFSMTKVESGTWKIGMRVFGTDSKAVAFERYTEMRFIFTKTAECCVDKLLSSTANVPVTVFTKDDKKKVASELHTILEKALWAKECNKYDVAQNLLKYITLQCECPGC
jgi:hypothetical protein